MTSIKLYLPFALATLTSCEPASITSIDGLAGGTLTSALTVPALTSSDVQTTSLDATGDITANSVTTGSVTSSGGVTGASMVVTRGNARVAVFGLIVGTTSRAGLETGPDVDGTSPNYAVRTQACAAAFPATDALPAAHVCSTQEAMAHALQSPETVPSSASGGIVHSYMSATYALPSDEGVEQIVNDCSAINGRENDTDTALRLHRRSDGNWALLLRNGCTSDDTLVCCQ